MGPTWTRQTTNTTERQDMDMSTTTTEALPKRTVTSEELARRFPGISSGTWRRWANEGRITGYRVSPRRLLIDLDEAERLIAEARLKPAVEPAATA
jgi:hypothetical protein